MANMFTQVMQTFAMIRFGRANFTNIGRNLTHQFFIKTQHFDLTESLDQSQRIFQPAVQS